MPDLALSNHEIAVLKSALRKGDPDPGFQELLLTLDRLLNPATGRIYLSQNTLELIQRYGYGSGNMTWKGTLYAIFGRALGETLGRKRDQTGRLTVRIETPKQDIRR